MIPARMMLTGRQTEPTTRRRRLADRTAQPHSGIKITAFAIAAFGLLISGAQVSGAANAVAVRSHSVVAAGGAAHAVREALAADVAPNPDFMSQCPAQDRSEFCLGMELEAIDNARALEGVAPVHLSLAGFRRLNQAEQVFALTDIERTARGLPPAVALTQQLDGVATVGAAQGADPVLHGWSLDGDQSVIAWGSNWSGGLSTLAANYYWMYSDGPGYNIDCPSATAAGCWAHRKNILAAPSGSCAPSGASPEFLMGAAASNSGQYQPSVGDILVQACGGTPSGVVITWARAEALIHFTP